MTVEEAVKKGFLENRKVYLRLLPRASELTRDPNHAAYGGFDGSLRGFVIGVDSGNRPIDPFKGNNEEREYFESIFKTDLNVHTPDNKFWKTYSVEVLKSPEIIKVGKLYNLMDPRDMLTYKVLLTNHKLVSKSWETKSPFHSFAFIDADYEEVEAEKEADENAKIWMFLGELKERPTKMREFLQVYWTTKRTTKQVPKNASKEFLVSEIQKIIKTDKAGYLALIEDRDYETKSLIQRGIDTGVIEQEGIGTFHIVGLGGEGFSYEGLIATLDKMKAERKDPMYFKMIAQIEKAEKGE